MEKTEEQIEEKSQCALYGYTASGKFVGDICLDCGLTYWKCHNCAYTITAAAPSEFCPECGKKCDFLNVTCYTLDCGGPDNIDPQLERRIVNMPLF